MSSPYLDTSFQDKLLDATTITHLFSTTGESLQYFLE